MMHGATARIVDSVGLPERSADGYLRHLDSARGRIIQNLDNPALSDEDRALLGSVVAQCDKLESTWDQIDRYCRRMPRTLVHADFVPKNLGTRAGPSGLALLVFDWEFAGWGNPAPDLAECPDLLTYQSAAAELWQEFDGADVRRMANVGRMFRQLADLDWQSWRFAYPWLTKPVARMREWRDAFHELTGRLDDDRADWKS
jgi:thiamine kinase-like enzyme